MRRKILFIMLMIVTIKGSAQTELEKVLSQIERNNKSLISEKQFWEAEKLSYRTGLNPENPLVEYEHLPGTPEGAGTQKDFSVTQNIDFPTSYGKRRNVSNQQSTKADLQFNATRQEVLLEAELLCIQIVNRKRLQEEFDKRLENANALLSAINRKAEQGESNVLDLNKIKLLQLEIKNQAALNLSELKIRQHKLAEMNGGSEVDISTLDYPTVASLPEFETLDSLIEANDPVVKIVKQDREVGTQQVGLTKSMSLPKFLGGYHQQSILGQRYQGFHVGMTIPLWENKNKVKEQQARLAFMEYRITEHRTEHYYVNKQRYEEYVHWQKVSSDYNEILSSANNEELLKRALDAGQVSLIEYLMEVRYFYDAIDKSLEAERELQTTISKLYKFQL